MGDPAISIFTPTLGRPSLLQLAKDLLPQLGERDEWILVGDAPSPAIRQTVESFRRENVHYYEMEPVRCWGYPQRAHAIEQARGTHLWGVDDDDRVAPWALETLRRTIVKHPCRPLMFRVIHRGFPIWRDGDPAVRTGNVSNQNFVAPNVKELLGQWGSRHCGDFDFIVSTVARYPSVWGSIVWCPEVVLMQGIADESESYQRLVESWVWTKDIWLK